MSRLFLSRLTGSMKRNRSNVWIDHEDVQCIPLTACRTSVYELGVLVRPAYQLRVEEDA